MKFIDISYDIFLSYNISIIRHTNVSLAMLKLLDVKMFCSKSNNYPNPLIKIKNVEVLFCIKYHNVIFGVVLLNINRHSSSS